MLRRLYRCAVRLHPCSFRRRFGEEMLYIFDQQEGMPAALGVTLDCMLSLLREWALRPDMTEPGASSVLSPATDHVPLFESLDPFRLRASTIIHSALLSLVLFYMTVISIPYSWIHVLHVRFPEAASNSTQQLSRTQNSAERTQVDVIPTESEGSQTASNLESKGLASGSPSAATGGVQHHPVTIWLDQYVGKYVSNNPPTAIWIEIENDVLQGNHLSLSLAAAGKRSLALAPVSASPARFTVAGLDHSYVEFTADVQGRICCMTFVENANVINAKRR
jgi:hypothetical protein